MKKLRVALLAVQDTGSDWSCLDIKMPEAEQVRDAEVVQKVSVRQKNKTNGPRLKRINCRRKKMGMCNTNSCQ